MSSTKKKILIASPDILGPVRNGGVGTACAQLAEILVNDGYEVDLLFTVFPWAEFELKRWKEYYDKKGIGFHILNNTEFEHQHGHYWVKISFAVYHWMKAREYDLAVFPDMFGVGYYSMIARQAGLAFEKTPMAVMFLGPQIWSRETNKQLFSSFTDLTIPMLERGSVEAADVVQFASQWSRDWADERGWKYANPFHVLFPMREVSNPLTKNKNKQNEIVFFGRVESRKGIEEFLDAIELMHEKGELKGRKVTLLGREGFWNGRLAVSQLEQWQERTRIKLKLVTELQSAEAIAYLRKKNAVAVIASQSETMGYTLIECLAHGIPCVCSDIEPFQEILGKKHAGVFEVGSAEGIRKALVSRKYILDVPRAAKLLQTSKRDWLRLVDNAIKVKAPTKKMRTAVSVLITHYNRANYLDEALKSLLAQTVMPAEILVYDDASPTSAHKKVIEKYKAAFATKKVPLRFFQGENNIGPGAGRNFMAEKAKSEFLLFMDDDNWALAKEIELLSTVQATLNVDVVTPAFFKVFDKQDDLWRPRIWTPVGFDVGASAFENHMGDTNFLVRRSKFLSEGGFDTSTNLYAEDMNLLIRLAKSGAKMAVCPEPTFVYRIHANNRSADLQMHESRLRNLKTHLSGTAGAEMSTLAHVILAWSYEKGHAWIKEPAPLPRIFKMDDAIKSKKVPVKYMKRNQGGAIQWSSSKIRKQVGIANNKPFYVAVYVKAAGEMTVKASNKVQEMTVPRGSHWLVFGVPSYETQSKVEFKSKKQIKVVTASAAPVPELKLIESLSSTRGSKLQSKNRNQK